MSSFRIRPLLSQTATLALCWNITAAPACAAEQLTLASDDWCPFVCSKNGVIQGGYLVELSRQVLAQSNIQLRPVLQPYSSALRANMEGDIEGVFAPARDRRIRRSIPLGYSLACFYTRPDDGWTYQTPASLDSAAIGVVENYGYDDGTMDDYIARHRASPGRLQFSEGATAGFMNVQKLLYGRVDVILEHEAVVTKMLQTLGAGPRLRKAGCLAQALPLTLGFSIRDQRSERWLQAVARGSNKLQGSAGIIALQQRYHIPAVPAAAQPPK